MKSKNFEMETMTYLSRLEFSLGGIADIISFMVNFKLQSAKLLVVLLTTIYLKMIRSFQDLSLNLKDFIYKKDLHFSIVSVKDGNLI